MIHNPAKIQGVRKCNNGDLGDLSFAGMNTLRKISILQSFIMRIHTQIFSVVIDAQVRIRQYVHRGH